VFEALIELILPANAIRPLDLDDLRRSSSPNDFLLADADLTPASSDGGSIQIVGLDQEAIHAAIRRYAQDEKGGSLRDQQALSGVYVIRTPILKYPNGLYYWIEPAEQGSRVSLYSKSIYGHIDYGKNQDYVTSLAGDLLAL
tara:strand:- start:179 stop:604 length:426 start_codon:yes stop_codon:yes gene_type:complete